MAERPAQDATSFVAPEGPYVLVDQFVVPTLPALPQAQQPPAFVFPRLSTVSVRYPATKANRSEKAAAAAAAATVAANSGSEGGGAGLVDSSAGSDASTSGDATAQGTAGAEAGRHFAGAAYPFLESTLAAQGIDAPASVLPGAPALGGMSLGLGSVGLGLGRSGTKASRPKNNIKTTSSSFVNRIQSHEQLTKILAQRTDADVFAVSAALFVA